MKFNNLRVAHRMGLGFGLVLLLLLLVALGAIMQLRQAQDANRSLIEREWVKADAAHTIDVRTRANARRTMELLITRDPARQTFVRGRIAENKKAIDTALAELDRLVVLPEGKQMLATLKTHRVAYVASFTKVSDLVAAGQHDEAVVLMNEQTLPAIDTLQESVQALATLQSSIVHQRSEQLQAEIDRGTALMGGLSALALLVGVAAAVLITRSITHPLQQAVDVARTVASGDLSRRIEVDHSDETGQLLGALREMNDSLASTVRGVWQASSSISTATQQIAAGNQDLSQRTEEQAAALEQTSASLQELSHAVHTNFESGRQANSLAAEAARSAQRGGEVMGEVVGTMHRIDEASKHIVEIIDVIDGIAFQTNLLALNAAVEAARAGEQGRGFAVVANEVRTLAGRSAEASRQIKSLIKTSVERVETGCQQVETAGATMQEILAGVRRVTSILTEISAVSEQQSNGLDQINQAVGQMDQVTQGNAALVEEAAAASESLAQQARSLVHSVEVFRLGGGAPVAA